MRIKVSISMLLLYLLIALMYLYPFADLLPSAVQIVIFVLWFFSLGNKKITSQGLVLSSVSIIIMVITLLRCIAAGQLDMGYYSSLQVVIQRYQFVIYPIIFLYVSQLANDGKRKIFNWAITCISITVIVSLYYIIAVDPQAVRNTQGVNYFGVGDFQLMYAIAMLFGPLLFLIVDKIKHKEKCLILLIELGLMGVCLILCNLVTSVVFAISSIGVTYCFTRKNKLMYVVIGIAGATLYMCKGVISVALKNLAAKNIFYWSTNNKILAIANVLIGDSSNVDTLSRRMMLSKQSLNFFKENILFGINFKDHVEGKIGCHAQWADDLGRYGLIGNLVIWINYFQIAKKTITYNPNSIVMQNMKSVWVCFFILGFLNPCLSGTILMAQFVIIPTFDALAKE